MGNEKVAPDGEVKDDVKLPRGDAADVSHIPIG